VLSERCGRSKRSSETSGSAEVDGKRTRKAIGLNDSAPQALDSDSQPHLSPLRGRVRGPKLPAHPSKEDRHLSEPFPPHLSLNLRTFAGDYCSVVVALLRKPCSGVKFADGVQSGRDLSSFFREEVVCRGGVSLGEAEELARPSDAR
jgi:hypothetical protein